MARKFPRLFRSKTATDRSGPAGDQPAVQAPSPTKSLDSTNTLKNAFFLLTNIAGAAPVPWVKPVADILIDILKRFDAMTSNYQDSQDIASYIDRFFSVISTAKDLSADDESMTLFKTTIQLILQKLPNVQNRSVAGFVNAQEITRIIADLKQDLDKAVQLLQTSLQIHVRNDQVKMFEELRNWKADGAEKENLGPGDIEMNMTRLKATTKGNVSIQTKGTGRVSVNTTEATFKTEKSYLGATQGARVRHYISNVEIDAMEDIDISVFATGA